MLNRERKRTVQVNFLFEWNEWMFLYKIKKTFESKLKMNYIYSIGYGQILRTVYMLHSFGKIFVLNVNWMKLDIKNGISEKYYGVR